VHRLGGHQHPDAGRNRNHVAAFTARSTACNIPPSISAGTRTVAAPITISITGRPPEHAGAIATSGHGGPASPITRANAEPPPPAGPAPRPAPSGPAAAAPTRPAPQPPTPSRRPHSSRR